MKKNAVSYSLIALAIALSCVACGDDGESPSTDAGTMPNDAGRDSTVPPPSPPPPPMGTVTCGSRTCQPLDMTLDQSVLDTLPACCMENDACGLDVRPAATYGVVVPEGCTEPGAEGAADPACPTYEYEFPMLSTSTPFAGCCLPSGRCGVRANLASLSLSGGMYQLMVEDFGCQETLHWFTDAPEPLPCGAGEQTAE